MNLLIELQQHSSIRGAFQNGINQCSITFSAVLSPLLNKTRWSIARAVLKKIVVQLRRSTPRDITKKQNHMK